MDKRKLKEKVEQLGSIQPWNHNYSLAEDIETRPGEQTSHGKNLIKWQRIESIINEIGVSNERILDIGCNEGFFSFKLADMGATVLGADVDEHRIEKALFIKQVTDRSDVNFEIVDIYSDSFRSLEKFDFCLCMGFLHRIPDPYRALESLSSKADLILFEWKSLKFGPHNDTFAYFSEKSINKSDFYGTEYWLLSYATLESILRRFGFFKFYRLDDPSQRRSILVAGRTDNPIFKNDDLILHRSKFRSLLSHTKRYFRTVHGIITGNVNY